MSHRRKRSACNGFAREFDRFGAIVVRYRGRP
jgi:hypothetical protein